MPTESTGALADTFWALPGRTHPAPDPSVTRPDSLPPGLSDLASHGPNGPDATNLL